MSSCMVENCTIFRNDSLDVRQGMDSGHLLPLLGNSSYMALRQTVGNNREQASEDKMNKTLCLNHVLEYPTQDVAGIYNPN